MSSSSGKGPVEDVKQRTYRPSACQPVNSSRLESSYHLQRFERGIFFRVVDVFAVIPE